RRRVLDQEGHRFRRSERDEDERRGAENEAHRDGRLPSPRTKDREDGRARGDLQVRRRQGREHRGQDREAVRGGTRGARRQAARRVRQVCHQDARGFGAEGGQGGRGDRRVHREAGGRCERAGEGDAKVTERKARRGGRSYAIRRGGGTPDEALVRG